MVSVALVYNTDFYLHRFRGSLIRALVDEGMSVHCIAPLGDYALELERMGAHFHAWNLSRRRVNPTGELASLLSLFRILRRVRPDLCHTFTLKPNVYGPVAAKLAGSRAVVSTYPGLGYLTHGQGTRWAAMMKYPVHQLMRLAGSQTDIITFQNRDDLDSLVDFGVVPRMKTRLIPGGSGVNTAIFSPDSVDGDVLRSLRQQIGIPDHSIVVLMAGRMLWDKGVEEYVVSARSLHEKGLDIRFLLAGSPDEGNPRAITEKQLHQLHESGDIDYLGYREDIIELMALADVFVYPSYYGEGIPRVLIEAAAMGKPIVTTDSVGCREVVKQGFNGILVPARSIAPLVDSIESLANDPALRCRYGRESRKRAEQEFDESISIKHTLALYRNVLGQRY